MFTLITGLIGTVLVVAFLGYYIIDIKSLPLSLIMILILGLVCYSLFEEVWKGNQRNNRDRG